MIKKFINRFSSNNKGLKKCISDLNKFTDVEAHFNVYKKNGDVLSQMIRWSIVKNWDIDLDFKNEDGYVLFLPFDERKEGNADHFRRFQMLDYFSDFVEVKEYNIKTYACFFDSSISVESVFRSFLRVLEDVYEYLDEVSYEVRVYE